MDIVYLIKDTVTGLKYIGSKKDWQGPGTYFGSPSCKSEVFKKYALQQEWKKAVKERPDSFELEVLESFDEIPHKELFEKGLKGLPLSSVEQYQRHYTELTEQGSSSLFS